MCCHDHIYPVVDGCPILFYNIVAPGMGTIIQSYYHKDGCNCGTYFVGILQMVTAVILVGWIWSIWHGMEVKKVTDEFKLAEMNRPKNQVVVVQTGMQPMSGTQVVYEQQPLIR